MRLPYRSTPLLIALQLAGIGCVQSAANLTFMFITSFGQFGLNTSGVVPAADMAIRDINSRSGLLPGYSLMYDSVKDSQCQYDKSLDAFFQGIMQSALVKLAVIGCGCSVATEPVAAISHNWNISQLFETTSDNPAKSANDFFMVSKDYRVFFLNSYSGPARKIICEAFRKNVTYPKYVWIMRDSFVDNWWTAAVDKGDVNCTDQELEMFLDKAISFRGYPLPENYTSITDAGITAQKFQDEYEYRALQMNYEVSDAGGRAYDAVWILAAALNRTMAMVKSGNINGTGCENITGSLVPLDQFQYSNEKMGCIIQYNIQITNFTGVSGHIQFDMNGTRIQNLLILKQYTRQTHGNMSRNLFAYLDAQHGYNFNFLPGVGDEDIYADGIPPDGTAINNTVTYSIPMLTQDWHMVLLTMIITGIGVCLLALATATTALDQFVVKVDHLENPTEKAPRDITKNNYILMCYGHSSPAYYLRALIFAYFAVLQILGIMLAFQTRKVKFPGLKDSKFVAIIMYTSSLVLLLLIVNAFAFDSYLNTSGSLHAIGVLILTTSILALIFIPKIVMLYKDSDNGESNSRNIPPGASIEPAERSLGSELCQRDKEINELKAEIAVLKGQLSKIQINTGNE
ncbi:hypothetical protein EMCRGX_G029358 [Ephydatia muelleri]